MNTKKLSQWFITIGLALALLLPEFTPPPISATPPPNFQSQTLLTGLNEPTTLTFTPDGRMLILERDGTIWIALSGATQVEPTPFLQITNINIDQGERGLVGIALDPAFASNSYYYVYYTSDSPLRDRVSRFTASGNGTVVGSGVVVWQDNVDAGLWHHGGNVAFGPDGKLYISVGDHMDTTYGANHVAQRLDSYRGKILRLNSDGTVPADNPFYDGSGPNLDAIWAMGLRNPFRFSFDSQTGAMYIGDVGGNLGDSIEEVNRGVAGANYGWPICEGPCGTSGMTNPIFSYSHNNRDASITGGFIYRASQFPAEYQGSYFYGDYAQNWIRRLTFDANITVTASLNFEPSDGALDGPYGEVTDLKPGPDGALYYVDIGPIGALNAGTIRRIGYTANQPPTIITATAAPLNASDPPLMVSFNGAAADPESDPLTYTWDFGDGNSSMDASPVYTYTQRGRYTARLTVSDGTSQTFSPPIVITVGNPPQPSVTTPISGTTFRAGDVITYAGTATDPDQALTPADYSWTVVFHHNDHLHPAEGPITGVTSSTLAIPITGHDFTGNTRFEIILTVTDADGIYTSDAVLIYPEKVNLAFDTTPSGLGLNFDQATNVTTPFVRDTLIGFEHTVNAPAQQVMNGAAYTFVAWADGVTSTTRIITVPVTDTTYVAQYAATVYLPVVFRP